MSDRARPFLMAASAACVVLLSPVTELAAYSLGQADLAPQECWFEIADPDARTECFHVVVPENHQDPNAREILFTLVYFLLAANLNMFLFSTNYLLETTPMKKHPTYIAVTNIVVFCFCFLPLAFGWLFDLFGFHKVMLAVAGLFCLGPVLCFSIEEPRGRGKGRRKKEKGKGGEL